jgi:hypothetical protein
MAQTKEQRQAAERQARRRAKLVAAMAQRDQLAAEVDRQAAEIERLETELADALDNRKPARCPTHGSELACPQCYQAPDF